VHLSVVTRVSVGNHFKLGATGLERHQEEHALGIQRGIDVAALTSWSHPIEHPEGGVIQISLGRHALIDSHEAPY
jgi:hypothetical protein